MSAGPNGGPPSEEKQRPGQQDLLSSIILGESEALERSALIPSSMLTPSTIREMMAMANLSKKQEHIVTRLLIRFESSPHHQIHWLRLAAIICLVSIGRSGLGREQVARVLSAPRVTVREEKPGEYENLAGRDPGGAPKEGRRGLFARGLR